MEDLTIIIVEDDAPLRTIMQLLLEDGPHRVEFAETGAVALAKAAELTADVIVIDVGLPDMSGFDLARKLRERGSSACLIAFTGFDDESSRERAQQAGFDDYYHKPLDLEAMESIFDRVIAAGAEARQRAAKPR